jgi:integration host factor subunit beta
MASTITKKDIIEAIAERTGHGKTEVRDIVQTFLDTVVEELARDNRLELRDFGVFETKSRAARKAQNPKTLAPVQVPARRTVKFKAGRLMRDALRRDAKGTKPPSPNSPAPNSQPSPGHPGSDTRGAA